MEGGGGVLCEESVIVGFAKEGGGPFVEFEELGEAAKVVTGLQFVGIERDGIFLCQRQDALRGEHAFKVQVEFGFG